MTRGIKKNTFDDEIRVAACIKDYKAKKFRNIKDAAIAHGLTYSKVRNRLAGVLPRGEAHVDQQLLTPVEERAIVAWILRLDSWGFPPRIKYVKNMATNFVRSHGVLNPDLGRNWTSRFITRHSELESRFAVRLDKQRGYANNPKIIKDFFKKVSYSIINTKYRLS